MAGTVLGFIKAAAGIGGILLPLFLSLVATAVSFQASLLLFPLAHLLAFFVLLPDLRRLGAFEKIVPVVEPAD